MHSGVRASRRGYWASAISLAIALGSTATIASPMPFSIDSEDARQALLEFGEQSAVQMLFASEKVKGIVTNAVHGTFEPIDALRLLLKGTTLIAIEESGGVLVVEPEREFHNMNNARTDPHA